MGEQLAGSVGVDAGDRGLLLGREEELRRLRDALRVSAGGFVFGPAGIGKSHLLAALIVEVEEDGTEVIAISGAQSAANVPLAPLLQLVDLEEVEDLGTAVMAELARRGRSREVMLAVDDAHLLDQDSAALINQAVVGRFACMLLAARNEKVLAPALEALWKDGFIERLDLGPLDLTASESITTQLLGEVAPPVHAWLWERSQGHPLFLTELIRSLSRSDLELHEVDLGEEVDFPEVPQSLADLIESYLNDLDSLELHALAAVSLAQPVARRIIERVASPAVVARLIRRGLIREYRAGLAVSHPLYGEVSVDWLLSDQAEELRTKLVDLLSRDEGNEIQVASLLLDGGLRPDLEILVAAVSEALTLRQPRLAKRFAQEVVELDPDPENLAKLAAAHAMLGDWETADALYGEAVGRLQPEGDTAAVWLPWIRSTFEYRGDPGRARVIAQQGMRELAGVDYQIARAYWLRARMFVEPLAPVFDELRKMRYDPDLDPSALAVVGVDLAASAWHMCRPHEGRRASTPVEFPERTNVDTIRVLQARCALAIWGLGLEPALAINRQLAEFAERTSDPYAQLQVHISRQIVIGRVGQAQQVADIWVEVQRHAAKTADRRWMPLLLAEAALAYSALLDKAEECSEVLRQIGELPKGAAYLTFPLTAISRARLAGRRGDLSEASDLLQQGVEFARERNAFAHELLCLREISHLIGATESIGLRAARIGADAGPGLAQLMAAEITALSREDAGELVAVSLRAQEYGARVLAWECAAAAQWIHHSHGDHRAAFECELRVRRLSESHPNQVSPAVERMEPTLTPSQSDVAALSATGATNAEIGEELFISPHTVKRHLEDIYKRLEITGRDELGEMYRKAGLIEAGS